MVDYKGPNPPDSVNARGMVRSLPTTCAPTLVGQLPMAYAYNHISPGPTDGDGTAIKSISGQSLQIGVGTNSNLKASITNLRAFQDDTQTLGRQHGGGYLPVGAFDYAGSRRDCAATGFCFPTTGTMLIASNTNAAYSSGTTLTTTQNEFTFGPAYGQVRKRGRFSDSADDSYGDWPNELIVALTAVINGTTINLPQYPGGFLGGTKTFGIPINLFPTPSLVDHMDQAAEGSGGANATSAGIDKMWQTGAYEVGTDTPTGTPLPTPGQTDTLTVPGSLTLTATFDSARTGVTCGTCVALSPSVKVNNVNRTLVASPAPA